MRCLFKAFQQDPSSGSANTGATDGKQAGRPARGPWPRAAAPRGPVRPGLPSLALAHRLFSMPSRAREDRTHFHRPARALPGERALPSGLSVDLEGPMGMGPVGCGPRTKKSSEVMNAVLLGPPMEVRRAGPGRPEGEGYLGRSWGTARKPHGSTDGVRGCRGSGGTPSLSGARSP